LWFVQVRAVAVILKQQEEVDAKVKLEGRKCEQAIKAGGIALTYQKRTLIPWISYRVLHPNPAASHATGFELFKLRSRITNS
jgi:hypothetical protein